jgi:hypothetical protein
MKLSLLGKYRSLSLALGLVPAFFVMEHVGPEGFPEAQGCSGSANSGAGVAPPASVSIHRKDSSSPTVAVATDAFFLIDRFTFVSGNPSDLTVSVTTMTGEEVAGAVKILVSQTGTSQYSWSANEPLAIGTKLKATVEGASSFESDQATLEVVGAPAELDAGTLTADAWLDYAHGIGAVVICMTAARGCAEPGGLAVPSREVMLHAATYGWTPAEPIHGFVAWEISLSRTTEVEAEDELFTPIPLFFSGPPPAHAVIGTLPFPKHAQEYCATYTVRDLRTGDEKSGKLCADPEPSTETLRDYALDRCSAPPSEELTEVWCQSHLGSTVRECLPFDPTVKPVDPRPADAPDGDPPMDLDDDGNASTSRTSSGCQMSSGASRGASLGLVVAATALGGLLRRRRAAR